MPTYTKDVIIKSVSLRFDLDTVEIQWATRFFEDGVREMEKFHRRAYDSTQVADLEADVPAGVATKIKNAMGWT